ncbi:MFS transporter [Stackebrandtia nassauensis]|uniref:Major facilitator superfamily MFS_1 n=1 Tax=Stackebrandtia nassauensis (strain DSM 44728 / CIP 108903 / NRRL B-16338 / NBRC 102104 / LLR-40K-21) TaxID=446470 RepID=D3PUZ5_STANL|nr:MFS transporter [Stackebrandtia nassauensis]ADD45019.1 major facilitator superfamily MFS_1 [Stackebrandtia nassauensis DSM 44728]
MSATDTSIAASTASELAGRRRGLIALCTTEITSWGVLYYAFPVLAGTITADTKWSTAGVMAAFSIGLAVSAAAGIPVGRLLDRHGPRPVMTAGSILGVVAVAGIALAPNVWWFIAAWALSGLAQACVFYKPAFAAITGWYGPDRVKALTALTLVAGLSSTIFAPVTATLADHTDWRTTYLVLGTFLAAVTIPAHAKFLSVPWKPNSHKASGDQPTHTGARAVIRSAPFVLLTIVIMLATFALFLATINLVPMLTEHGASTSFAAWVLGLCGAGQLLGRIGYARLTARTSVRTRTVAVFVAAAVALAATALTTGQPVAVILAAIVFGATRGVFTLLEATAVSDRWGTDGFGTLYGIYSAPSTVAMAATPFAGAVLAAWFGGNQPLFLVMAAVLVAAGIAAIWTIPSRRESSAATESS